MARSRDPQRERMVRRWERRKIRVRCRAIVVCVRVLSWGSNALTRACSQNQFSLFSLFLFFVHTSCSFVEPELFQARTSCTLNYLCNFLGTRDVNCVAGALNFDLLTISPCGIPSFKIGVDGSVLRRYRHPTRLASPSGLGDDCFEVVSKVE